LQGPVPVIFLPDTIAIHWRFDTGPDRFADRICVLHLPLISTLIAGLSLPSSYAVERWNLSYCEVFRRMMLLLNLVVFTMCLIGILFIAAYNT
jgi:hypothetical protein